ncbi:MAG TPA: hypothetical protein VHC63_00880 [Acidimicrobiales bacterium]|nr:hypothetical protein [Acidimicrobiales bacterium]
MTSTLTAADDRFHDVADTHPLWTETTWWGLHVPERSLGGMIYTLFRPNLGVATLLVAVWDAEACEPWRVPYHRSQWHIPLPDSDLDDIDVGGLRIRVRDPLRAYELTYADGEALTLDLRVDAAMDPHVAIAERRAGHFDQLCRVTGRLVVAGEPVDVDCLAIRDRSWYVRDDARSMQAGYVYGAVDEHHQFLAFTGAFTDDDTSTVTGGYLIRDGEKATLTGGTRTVVSRRRGHPDAVTLTATDALGREFVVSGRVTASLASQSTPGMFAWMSIADWTIDGRAGHGEDHDVWSPDRLAHRPAAAGAGR